MIAHSLVQTGDLAGARRIAAGPGLNVLNYSIVRAQAKAGDVAGADEASVPGQETLAAKAAD